MPEHLIHVTVSEHGFDPENGVRLTDTFFALYPEVGAAISQNVRTGTLSMTYAVEASDAQSAIEMAAPIFANAMVKAGLKKTQILSVGATVVDEAAREDREAVLA